MTAGRLWFPIVAPPLAFGVEGAIGWWAGSAMCTAMSVGTARALMGAVSVVMLAIAVWALATGLSDYREASAQATAAGDRVEFMALGGVFVSTSFLIGLVWFGLNAVFIDVCGGMR